MVFPKQMNKCQINIYSGVFHLAQPTAGRIIQYFTSEKIAVSDSHINGHFPKSAEFEFED